MIKQFWIRLLLLFSLCAVLVFTGCVSGTVTKTYWLKLTVLNGDLGDAPVAGATVRVAGKSLIEKNSDTNGEVMFNGLSGKVEVSVEGVGFDTYVVEYEIKKSDSVTVRLKLADTTVVVGDGSPFEQAVGDYEVKTIFLAEDISEGDTVVVTRPLNINLSGKTLRRDVRYDFAEDGTFHIYGPGNVDGNVYVNAPLATVSNYAEVRGLIHIDALSAETWNEFYGENSLVVASHDVTVNLFKGATSIYFAENARDNILNISDVVELFVANSSVRVVGSDKIVRAVVNAEGVVLDYSPAEIDGSVAPEILYPKPDDPTVPDDPKYVAGPRFVTLSKQQPLYDFDRSEFTDDPSRADIELSWLTFGNEYTNYFKKFEGTWFKVDALDHRSDETYQYFRTADESNWEARDPIDMGRVGVNDTVLLKTNGGRFVKLFVIDSRGHWNHDNAPEVDFVYLFTDEIDLDPPAIESITLVMEGGGKITKEITDVIEFVVSDLEGISLVLNLSEIAYNNRGLVQSNPSNVFRPYTPLWSYAYPPYYNRPNLADQFGGAISVGGENRVTLIPGDDEFWQQLALSFSSFDDLGYHYCDLMGNALTELPFSQIIIKRDH